MQKRGTNIGLEYRYALTNASGGTIMADGLQDRQIDDGTPENTLKWGYAGDAYDRPNTDRYWLRAKVDQELPWGAKAQAGSGHRQRSGLPHRVEGRTQRV
jgi:LPS-assembly protein